MITIVDVNSTEFTFNGIRYYKNFTPVVKGDYIQIVNTYDANLNLCEPTIYSDFTIDASTYGTVALTQDALLPAVFTRSTLGGGGGGTGTVTSVAVSGSDGIEVDSGSPITTSGTIALGLNRANLVSFLALLESEVKGVAIEDATFTGTENLDLSTFAFADITLTGNTTITVTNTPSVDNSFVRNLTIRSTATETLTLPVSWVVIGEYVADGSDNYFSILFNNLTTAGASVICYISQEA